MTKLKEMANELATNGGEIVSYFGKHSDKCAYNSKWIYDFFTCCEEVGYAIKDGDYETAERIIFTYLCLEKLNGEDEKIDQPKEINKRNVESVAELIFIYKLENGLIGIVRADDIFDAIDRIDSYYNFATNRSCVSIERMTEVENMDYGIYEME